MPAKKKTKTKKKKATSSSFGELYVDVIKNRDNSPKQRKINKLMMKPNASTADRNLLAMMLADAGKGFENVGKPPVAVNVYTKARAVKNYKELQHFIDRYCPSITEADMAKMAADHVSSDWLMNGISKDPDHYGAVMMLLQYMSDNSVTKTYKSRHLKRFAMWTGYKVPATISTFKNHMTSLKNDHGDKRAKKKVPHYKDKEFKI